MHAGLRRGRALGLRPGVKALDINNIRIKIVN